MVQPVTLELTLVEDVPGAYATVVAAAVAARQPGDPLRLACSGGTTGRALADRLAAAAVEWAQLEVYFVDERWVSPDSPDANEAQVRQALGAKVGALAGFHPMRCADGAAAYEAVLAPAMPLDLVQLGVGPDGHTASLFPGSAALEAPAGRLVVENEDPSGRNRLRRCTLTYGAIAASRLVVVTLTGADKRPVLEQLAAGADLPAARLRPGRLVWLVDPAAAGDLAAHPASTEELVELGRGIR